MAELIQRDDSLNTGREKLNEAIKASDRAEGKSDYAVETADTAKSTADTTREEMTEIIREQTNGGDIVPEVVQARGGEASLGNRLNSINQVLAQTDEKLNEEKHKFKNIQNTDGAITNMINVGLTYANRDDFVYGNARVLNDARDIYRGHKRPDTMTNPGKWEIDCSSFISALLMGIPFEKSAYVNKDAEGNGVNFPSQNGYKFDLEKDKYPNPIQQTAERMLANDIAWYAYERGWEFVPNDDFSNVQVGDFLLLTNSNESQGFFRNIGHISVVIDIQSGTTDGHTSRFTVLQAGGHKTSDQHVVSIDEYTVAELKGERVNYVARFPLYDANHGGEPITLELGNQEITNQAALAIPTKKRLQKNKLYTVIFKFESNISGNTPRVRVRNESGGVYTVKSFYMFPSKNGYFKTTFYINNQQFVANPHFELLQGSSVTGTGTFNDIQVYDGYVSEVKTNNNEDYGHARKNNGHTVKFPDGTMICWHTMMNFDKLADFATGNIFRSDYNTWTFPEEFSGTGDVVVTASCTLNNMWADITSTPSTTSVNVAVYSSVSKTASDVKPNVFLMAIGRWK